MEERITRKKAIRLKCLDCCCGNRAEVRSCPATGCPLWPYRLGREDAPKYPQNTGVSLESPKA